MPKTGIKPGTATSCPECDGKGYTEGPGCNCGGYGEPYYQHERYCGLEPCPAGCPFVPPEPVSSLLAAGEPGPATAGAEDRED